jgi:hypothetical protein
MRMITEPSSRTQAPAGSSPGSARLRCTSTRSSCRRWYAHRPAEHEPESVLDRGEFGGHPAGLDRREPRSDGRGCRGAKRRRDEHNVRWLIGVHSSTAAAAAHLNRPAETLVRSAASKASACASMTASPATSTVPEPTRCSSPRRARRPAATGMSSTAMNWATSISAMRSTRPARRRAVAGEAVRLVCEYLRERQIGTRATRQSEPDRDRRGRRDRTGRLPSVRASKLSPSGSTPTTPHPPASPKRAAKSTSTTSRLAPTSNPLGRAPGSATGLPRLGAPRQRSGSSPAARRTIGHAQRHGFRRLRAGRA